MTFPTCLRQSGTPMRALFLAVLLGLSSCAQFVENIRPVIFGKTAQDNYERGMRSLRGESYQDAAKYFQYVKDHFGFSKWSTLAELGLADAAFGKEAYIEAIDGYKAFMLGHPSHEQVVSGYAAFRIGEAYYKQVPSDFFLLPPSYEKDQGAVLDAMRELEGYLDKYGDSKYATQARKMFAETIRHLADHELYVARYYLDKNRPQAAIWRLEYVVNKYPGARREPEVLMLLGRVYLKQDKPREARDTFRRLRIEYPNDYHAAQAQLFLDYIARNFGNLPPPGDLPPRRRPTPTPTQPAPGDDDDTPVAPDPAG